MSITINKTIDGFIDYGEYFILGPSMIYCPNPDVKGYGDMLLTYDLFDFSDSNVGEVLWRSQDNGETWEKQGFIDKSYVCDFKGSMIKSGYGSMYADTKTGVIILFGNDIYWEDNNLKSSWKYRALYYRLSFDNGYTWADKRYIVQKGLDQSGHKYDRVHFLKDVSYGTNMASTDGVCSMRADDDTILVGMQAQIVDENNELINPTGMGYLKSGCIKVTWIKEKLDYEFDMGEYASVTLNESTRGVFEPTFAKVGKNKLVMIMRASNSGNEDFHGGTKFISVSDDNGMTWSRPKPLTYDDGSVMYSSSCMPKLLNHSNGKIYYIGMINESNPCRNLPRYPICIAELDDKTYTIKKDTVVIIDTKRKNHEPSAPTRNLVDYSNQGIYEDKKTGQIVVYAPYREDLTEYACVLNKYVIDVL